MTATTNDTSSVPTWWQDAKFGLFVHWGPYSQAGVEASWPIMVPSDPPQITQADYEALATTFDPHAFDATELVELARAAGQRYIVFTSKHHDGYCMWDSTFTDYKITNTAFGRDVCAELAAAANTAGMPLAWYHSQPDLHHPGFRDTSRPASENWHGEPTRPEWFGYLSHLRAQLTELLTRYGPIYGIWFDGLSDQQKYDPFTLNAWLKQTWPGLIINDRNGASAGMGAQPGTEGALLPAWAHGDYLTPEQQVPDHQIPVGPWETCMTINGTWAYNPDDREFKSPTTLIHTLAEVVSKGGNLLLNVGPRPDGTVPPELVERLHSIGAWLRRHGDAIYGTRVSPLMRQDWGWSTARDGVIYLLVRDFDGERVVVDGLTGHVRRVRALGVRSAHTDLTVERDGDRTTITVPAAFHDEHLTVIAVAHG